MNETLFYAINGLANQNEFLDSLFVFISNGFGFLLLGGLLAYLALHTDKKRVARDLFVVLTAAVGAYVISKIIKTVFPSPRPFEVLPEAHLLYQHGGGDSFPSGHATFYMALGSALWFYHRKLAYAYIAGAFIVGVGRILVGVHWPFDVLAGFVLGGVVGVATYLGYKKLYKLTH